MKCIRCGNETYKSTTTEAIELEGGVLVIRNAKPAMKSILQAMS